MRKGLSLGPGAHQLGWLKSEPQKSICLHLRDAGITNAQPHWLLHRCGWSDSCSHACLADTLPTELLPQSQRWWLFKNLYPIYNLMLNIRMNPSPPLVFVVGFVLFFQFFPRSLSSSRPSVVGLAATRPSAISGRAQEEISFPHLREFMSLFMEDTSCPRFSHNNSS